MGYSVIQLFVNLGIGEGDISIVTERWKIEGISQFENEEISWLMNICVRIILTLKIANPCFLFDILM